MGHFAESSVSYPSPPRALPIELLASHWECPFLKLFAKHVKIFLFQSDLIFSISGFLSCSLKRRVTKPATTYYNNTEALCNTH